MTVVAGTGHRPDKLGGYTQVTQNRLYELCCIYIEECKPDAVISGMALGFDQYLAIAALKYDVKLIAAIPCPGQEKRWPQNSQDLYKAILSEAAETHIISPEYTSFCMQQRNIWMVDHADEMVALWDGSAGGTGNCIKYAQKVSKPVVNLWEIYQTL